MTLRKSYLSVMLILLILSGCTSTDVTKYETVKLIRVVDGDTILIDRSNQSTYVRLLGIDAPESVHPDPLRNTEDGRKASAFLKSLLKSATLVYIVKDVSEVDKYGRLLRYVWLRKPISNDETQIRGNMVNAMMLIQGYATNVTIQPDVKYAQLFLGFTREARLNNAGLWGK